MNILKGSEYLPYPLYARGCTAPQRSHNSFNMCAVLFVPPFITRPRIKGSGDLRLAKRSEQKRLDRLSIVSFFQPPPGNKPFEVCLNNPQGSTRRGSRLSHHVLVGDQISSKLSLSFFTFLRRKRTESRGL